MNRLILLRHGKAEADSDSGRDFDRRLALRGREESAAMARLLAEQGLSPQIALVSPAVRTRETWAAAQAAFPGVQVQFDEQLYHADTPVLRQLVARAAKATPGAVMVVGHNPGLQDLTVRLLTEGLAGETLIGRARLHFPTAAAAVFLIDAEGRPEYDGLFFPRDGRS